MAQAAEELVKLTDRQITLTICEIVGLLATVILTAIAAGSAAYAARVANKQTKISEITQKPFIFFEITKPGIVADSGGLMNMAGQDFVYQLINQGATPAHITERCIDFKIHDIGDQPDFVDPHITRGTPQPLGTISTAAIPFEETIKLFNECDMSPLYERDAWKKYTLFVIGFVRFIDVFQEKRIIGFRAAFDPIRQRFEFVNDDRYNYNCKDDD
jgi:hypothetical protein